MQTTVTTDTASGRQRWLRTVLATVVAIVIAGSLAAPTEAEQRPEAKEANDFIEFCFRSGGDPIVLTYPDDSIIVVCQGLTGGDMKCEFKPGASQDCWLRGPEDPGGVLPTQPVDGVFVEDEPAPGTPGEVYEADPIWTLAENDGGTEAPLLAVDDTQAAPPVEAPLVAESELTAPVEVVEAEADVVETPAEAPTSAAVTEVVDIPAEEPVAAAEPMAGEASTEQP